MATNNFKGQLFQLLDNDSEPKGLIYTPNIEIKENRVEDLWQEFCKEFDADAENFIEYLNNKLNPLIEFPNGIYFERVFASETFA